MCFFSVICLILVMCFFFSVLVGVYLISVYRPGTFGQPRLNAIPIRVAKSEDFNHKKQNQLLSLYTP
jgi:hypothetical protein